MPVLEPVPFDGLDPQVKDLLGRAQSVRSIAGDTTTPRLWAHRPELAAAQLALHTRFHDSNIVDGRVLELVRMSIAMINDCASCKAARKSDDVSEDDLVCLSSTDPRFSPRERSAMRFAELLAADHMAVDDDVMADLAAHFTPAEIVEIAMYSALMLGGGRFAYVMRGYETDERPPVVPVVKGTVAMA